MKVCHTIRLTIILVIAAVSFHLDLAASVKDSSDFVRASLVVATPGKPIYSVFGHCALRMQCPSEGLDYCFSLEMEPTAGNYMKFLSGKLKSEVVAVPYRDYVKTYKQEGRGLNQYELNLTLPEKRLLWKNLDDAMMMGPSGKFNLVNTNCVQFSYDEIMDALINDSVTYSEMPKILSEKNGDRLRYYCRSSKWAEFVYITVIGATADDYAPIEYSLSPETIVKLLASAQFVDIKTGKGRQLFRNSPTVILKGNTPLKQTPLTPNVVFGMLLLMVVVVTFGEKRFGWHRISKYTDITLFAFQTIIGVLLTYIALSSNLFGSRWNWYLIPFNPIPAIILMSCHRHQRWHDQFLLLYSIILIVFILAISFSKQFNLSDTFICISLAICSLKKFIKTNNISRQCPS